MMKGRKSSSKAQPPAQAKDRDADEDEGEELLEELGQHARHGELHAFDVIHNRRQQRSGGILLEESDRAAQRRAMKIVAHVGDHAVSRIVRQVGAEVVEEPFYDRGDDQRKGNDGPYVVKVPGNERAQVEIVSEERDRQQRQGFRLRRRVKHLVENRSDEQQTKGVKQAYQRHRENGAEQVEPVRLEIAEESAQSTHNLRGCRLDAAGRRASRNAFRRVRCKSRFYWICAGEG